jgi:predicted NAD-dependent protein-ADP-ribosyltransferase YbiA (DUF1768 family)
MPTYEKASVAWFFSTKNRRFALSNMASHMPIYWPLKRCEAHRWESSEHLYQAAKYDSSAKHPLKSDPLAEPHVRKRIKAAPTPLAAKWTQKGAYKAGLFRSDWEAPEEVRLKAMRWVLELKLFHNPLLFGKELLATGHRPIVEISSNSTFWGCKEDKQGLLTGWSQSHEGVDKGSRRRTASR